MQIYGSPVSFDTSRKFRVSPIEDANNVDKRHAEIGLQPNTSYFANWTIKWEIEAYKKQEPRLNEERKNYEPMH